MPDSPVKLRRTSRKVSPVHSNDILFDSTVLNEKNRTKMDFDHYLNTVIPDNVKIELKQTRELKNYTPHKNEELLDISPVDFENRFKLDLLDHKTKICKVPNETRKRGRPFSKKDPLADSKYTPMFDLMLKDEKRFIDAEKSLIKKEIDEYYEILPLLGVELKAKDFHNELLKLNVSKMIINDELLNTIKVILPKLVKINDPKDTDEILMKYKLTIKEMRSNILKYTRLKKLDEMLRKENILYWQGEGVHDQEPKTAHDIKALRKRRLEIRNELIGPIKKIKFPLSGVQINLDPICAPYISKIPKKNSK